MSKLHNSEALSAISSAVDETHDGLAQFTEKLKAVDDIPAFWWGDHPVWVSPVVNNLLDPWPLKYVDENRVSVENSESEVTLTFSRNALREFSDTLLKTVMTEAEFTLFSDLATGLSLEESALRAGVATSTRRKQLQACFRKLNVVSQAELVSLANRVIDRLSTTLGALLGPADNEWTSYARYFPVGVRCGVLEGVSRRAVRYLEIGPISGRPVFILHPMMFPNIEKADVELFHELGWRTIWPIRDGCLSSRNLAGIDWDRHCEQTVADIHTLQHMCADVPVPIIALVSSGAYATKFAAAYPQCVERIDYVSTCFSAGKRKSRDVYFGDFLLRNLRQNGRMAVVAIQHIAGVVFGRNQLESTLRRVFKGSAVDQAVLDEEFATPARSERAKYAVRSSIDSMRYDYLSQLSFSWSSASKLETAKQFWHGAQDRVHNLDDLSKLSQKVTGRKAKIIPELGHLTQGAPLRETFHQIAMEYSK